jgi:hypothetical protein
VIEPKITVGARINQPSTQNEQRGQTLDEIMNDTSANLEKYSNAIDIRVIEDKKWNLGGFIARSITLQYTDSQTKIEWYFADTNVIDGAGIVYFIELESSPKNALQLKSTYNAVVNSLNFECARNKH